MLRFVLARLASLAPVLLGLSVVTFLLLRLDPVDPAVAYLRAVQAPPTDEAVAAVRVELGLDRPVAIQYWDWLNRASRLDLGVSYLTRRPVLDELLYHLPATLQLVGASLLLTVLVSVPLGVLSALHKNGFADHACRFFCFVGASVPSFWLGFLLIHLFAVNLGWLPAMGRGGPANMILPTFTLSFTYISLFIRLIRAGMLDNLHQRFVLYARARGVRERWVIGRHVVRHSLIPLVTALGMCAGNLIGASAIAESVFAWPGVALFAVKAILNRDLPMVQGYLLMMSSVFVLCNLMVDVLYAWIDPRIRMGDSAP